MDVRAYTEFSLGVHRRAHAARLPVDATIELTHRCPLACAHCYNNLPPGDRAAAARELSTEEHFRLIDEIAEAGALWVLLTGGEALARGDFAEIYLHAKRRGLLVILFTNGVLVTPELAGLLGEYRPFYAEITLYGSTPETYERVTRVPGSFARCLRGIRLLREREVPLRLKSMLLTINCREREDMRRLAEEELGCAFKIDPMLNPRLDGNAGPLRYRLSPEEIVAIDMEDPARAAEWRRLAARLGGAACAGRTRYRCGGGTMAFTIDPYGMLRVCSLSADAGFDVRRGGFRAGWEEWMPCVRGAEISRRTKCTDCSLAPLCGMCPAQGMLAGGDGETPVDFLCRVAHLRARAFGIEVAPHGPCEYCGEDAPLPRRAEVCNVGAM